LIGVGAAYYGTWRSLHQLLDKGIHDELINSLTDSEARMLWLDTVANILSFGAMGVTMRMVSLAASGKNFSASFCAVVNILNGSVVTFGRFAILNSTIFMIENWENMSPTDILM
jgi:hypothetical protein